MSTALLETGGQQFTVLSCTVTFPFRGVWSARGEVDADEDTPLAAGSASLNIGADNDGEPVTLVGTIGAEDVSTFEGRAQFVLVAGAGALATLPLVARNYQQAPLDIAAADLITDAIEEAGELVESVSVPALLPRWLRAGGRTAAQLLDRLAERLGVGWRMGDAGGVSVIAESWPAADEEDAELYIEGPEDAVDRTLTASVGRASIRPGTTLRGRRLEEVAYSIEEGREGIRVLFRFGPGEGAGGLREDFERAARGAQSPPPYREVYAATVRRQLANGSLDVEADDQRIGGITAVPYKPGIVVCRLVVDEGERVRLGFEGGDETKPYAFAWDPIQDGKGVARLDDEVDVGTLTFVGAPDGQGGLLSVVVTYHAPDGSAQSGTITSAGAPVNISLKGLIVTASDKVFIKGPELPG